MRLPSPSPKLLLLCSAAVGALYAGGYLVTAPSASGSSPPIVTGAGTSKTPSSPGTPQASTISYKDGQYTGSGSNPFGTLSVSVTVAQGKITSVRITQYAMHYPASYIDPAMNDEVVAHQTWHVYGVSGATASSENFAEAVYQALQKARA